MHQTLVDHGFCLTQETDAGPLLGFLLTSTGNGEIRSTNPASCFGREFSLIQTANLVSPGQFSNFGH
jgi:hypothetical protein